MVKVTVNRPLVLNYLDRTTGEKKKIVFRKNHGTQVPDEIANHSYLRQYIVSVEGLSKSFPSPKPDQQVKTTARRGRRRKNDDTINKTAVSADVPVV